MNTHTLLTLILILSTGPLYAKSCFEVNSKDVSIGWTAFKTPAKVGVSGTLPNITLTGATTGSSIADIIGKTSLTIDANEVDSKKEARDKKISNFFFGKMRGGKTIKATVVGMNKKTIKVKFVLNKQSTIIPMSYKIKSRTLLATGYMDILDFGLNKSLSSLNQACKAMHEGKTWTDVSLKLSVQFKKCK